MDSFQLVLVDPQPSLVEQWKIHFDGLPHVQVAQGHFQDVPEFDCMVSPANSFGLMDGGVDAAITQYFGVQLMQQVQRRIVAEYLGEQPVGSSMIVGTGHPKHPFLAHTPTMRVPMSIAGTDNVYLAMWAMLLAVRNHNSTEDQPIKVVACPGLGTGTGEVPASEAARQMALAYRNFLHPPFKIDWRYADERQAAVGRGGDLGFILARAKVRPATTQPR